MELTNAEREAEGKSPLTMADGLTAGAEIRVQEITDLGASGQLDIYKHTRPENKGYYDTVLEGKYIYPGENLDGGARSPAQVLQDWMSSDAHKENILRDNFQKLGVGYNENDADPSNLRFYWVQLFADSLKAQTTVDVSNASPQTNAVSKFIQGDDSPNTISNGEYGVTIDARGGGDSVTNSGLLASVSGGNGDDTLNNSGNFSTINGGLGNDSISLGAAAKEIVIEYAAGDGSDTVSGLNATDTVSISGDEFTPAQIGNDIVVTVGADSITLLNAARDGVQFLGSRSKIIILTDGDDSIDNTIEGAIIQAKRGNDTIENYGAQVSIDGAAGNNFIGNHATGATVDGGIGNDYIQNTATDVSIAGNSGNDNIHNLASNVTIETGEGNDSVANLASNVTIDGGEYNDAIDNFYGSNVSIAGGKGNDTISNSVSGSDVTITGGEGQDFIVNEGANVTINAGTSVDRISLGATAQNNLIVYNAGDSPDVIAGLNETSTLRIGDGTGTYATQQSGSNVLVYVDDATITLRGAANVSFTIEGAQGELPDTTAADRHILLAQGGDTYRNYRDDVTIEAVNGDDYYIVNEGSGVSVSGADGKDSIGNKGTTVIITGNGGEDFLSNEGTHVGVMGGAGKDSIENIGALTIINADDDDDTITNWSDYGKIGGGAGNDSIYNEGLNTTILGFEGNDTVINRAENVTILGGENDDLILNTANNVLIHASTGDDIISLASGAQNALIFYNAGDGADMVRGFNDDDTLSILGDYETMVSNDGNHVFVITGTGHNVILENAASLSSVNIVSREEGSTVEVPLNSYNTDNNKLITGTAYGDTVYNDGNNVTIQARGNNDKIENWSGSNVLIDGGAGNDSITNYKTKVTINAGTGDDRISLSGDGAGSFIQYTPGDGNDTIWGLTENSRLQIGDGTGTYSTVGTPSGDDIIIRVGNGSIRLVNFRDNPEHVIIGESGTSGGGSGSGGSGGGSSSDNSSGGSGGIGDGGGQSGGNTSGGTSASEGNTGAASGGGRSASGSSGNTDSSGRGNGGNFRVIRNNHSTTANAPTVTAPTATPQQTPSTQQTSTTTTTTATQRVYTGGNQVIANYASGERITFGAQYTGAFYDGNGNFFAGSTTGALVVQNAADKVIDLVDAAGNSFVKAYAATTAGVIDGRGLAGFEIINGSAGSDAIYAGDGGSQLWGGADSVSDAMMGGNGTDIFIGGRTQGADFFLNASSADIVHLNDTTLSDIVATAEENGTIGIAFNTGNVVAMQSSEALSATVMLADGSAYRFNHANKSWQTA